MRQSIRTFTLLLGLALAAGCHDGFLEEQPYDFVAPENFFKTVLDGESAVSGIYSTFIDPTALYGRDFMFVLETPTETVTTRQNSTNPKGQLDAFRHDSGHEYLNGAWRIFYLAINRANTTIEGLEGATFNPAVRDRLIGEAKFLRALAYFNLVQLFGDVPLKLEATSGLDNLTIARAPQSEVYAAIIADLEAAAAILPLKSAYTGMNIGRASRGAAQTLLAKTYMTRGALALDESGNPMVAKSIGSTADFQKAVDLLKQVQGSGQYQLISLSRLWPYYKEERNAEIVFDFTGITGTNSRMNLSGWMTPRGCTMGRRQFSDFHATLDYFLSFQKTDQRMQQFVMECTLAGSNKLVRFDPNNVKGDGYVTDGPAVWKYIDDIDIGTGDNQNFVLLRYADVLLSLAEAANEAAKAPTGEAYAAINTVRSRASLPDLTPGLSYAQFKDSVFVERRKEFIMEGWGWYDSIRNWTWFKKRLEAHMQLGQNNASQTAYVKEIFPLEPRYRFMPIPQNAIDRNPELTQNPGWDTGAR